VAVTGLLWGIYGTAVRDKCSSDFRIRNRINADWAPSHIPVSNEPFRELSVIFGAAIGIYSHFVLLWSGWKRKRTLGQKLFLWVGGWIVAAGLFGMAQALLLGIS
jgi:hypothetical protein